MSPSQQALKLYQKSYKGGGAQDRHLAVFQQAKLVSAAQRVLYPGCHRHLTASLVFREVVYVDSDQRVASLYGSSDKGEDVIRHYVESNKIYDEPTKYQFFCCDVHDGRRLSKMISDSGSSDAGDFDLLVSLSAGTIAQACTNFVKTGGYLLVNDSHSDARTIFVGDNDWELVACWDDDSKTFAMDKLDRCFQVVSTDRSKGAKKKFVPMTMEHVQESVAVGTVSKRSFKVLYEPDFFLFRKL